MFCKIYYYVDKKIVELSYTQHFVNCMSDILRCISSSYRHGNVGNVEKSNKNKATFTRRYIYASVSHARIANPDTCTGIV